MQHPHGTHAVVGKAPASSLSLAESARLEACAQLPQPAQLAQPAHPAGRAERAELAELAEPTNRATAETLAEHTELQSQPASATRATCSTFR